MLNQRVGDRGCGLLCATGAAFKLSVYFTGPLA